MMEFKFQHPATKEIKVVHISEEAIRIEFEDVAHAQLDCNCEIEGRNYDNQCDCDDYFEEFEPIREP